MTSRLLSRREGVVWAACFLVVSVVLIATEFTSNDPDSALYAGLADRIAREPVNRWIAPEWWDFWPDAHMTGLFREHPAGVLLVPAALARLGIPAMQGAYVVGAGAGLAALLMMASLVRGVTSREDARAALVLLQIMPVAFIFRIRANHEYPMLVCLLLAVIGLASIARGRPLWQGAALVALGLTAGLFVKGVFVVQILIALAVWSAVNPPGRAGLRWRYAAGIAIGIAVMVAGAAGYDAAYRAATSGNFWAPYWERQMGPLAIGTALDGVLTALRNLAFYLSRLAWHPAPWSLALIVAAWRMRDRFGVRWREVSSQDRRSVLFALGFAALAILVLTPASRFAERYAFAATYAVACAGVVAACRWWPSLADGLRRLDDRIPALPALLWLALALLRVSVGPLLPRV